MEISHCLGLNFFLILVVFSLKTSSKVVTSIDSPVVKLSECSRTALHEATQNGTIDDVYKALDSGTDMYALDCQGLSAMHLAIQLNKSEVIYALVEKDFDVNYQFRKGEPVLFFAIRHGNAETVRTLITLGSNVNIVTPEGSTPLLEALIKNNEDMIKLLGDYNASYNMTLPDGDTCLHRAAESGSLRLVLMQIKLNFDLNKSNILNETPLTKAVTHNHPTIVNLLISRGANDNIKSASGETLIYQAVTSKSLGSLRALLENGGDPNSFNNNRFYTPLYAAMKVNSRAAAEILIQFRADLQKRWTDWTNINILHVAARDDYPDSIPWLVDLGLNVNSTDSYLMTPLHYAATKNNINAAKVLVNLKACLNCKNSSGYTPRDKAITIEMRNLLNY